MLTFDDMEPVEKIKIYDKSAKLMDSYDHHDEEYIAVQSGDIFIPKSHQKNLFT